jgi:hypothetical protein
LTVHSNPDVRVVLAFMAEREVRLHATRLTLDVNDHDLSRRPLRRWVGRQLVRLGTRLAGEPSMRPARAR